MIDRMRQTRRFAKQRVAARLVVGGLIHTPSAVWMVRQIEHGPVSRAYPDGSLRVWVEDGDVQAIFLYHPTQELLMVGDEEWEAYATWLGGAIRSQYTSVRQ